MVMGTGEIMVGISTLTEGTITTGITIMGMGIAVTTTGMDRESSFSARE